MGRSTKNKSKRKSKRKQTSQILAMVLIGAGLIFLGGLALVLLPKSDAGAVSSQAVKQEGGELPSSVPLAVDFAAPELDLTDLDGSPVSLADYAGQVVLLNNWAIWCPPCKEEMPVLQAYYDAHQGQGFTIIAIEAGQPVQDVAAFAAEYGLTFPVWPDQTNESLRTFQNNSLPNSYVIDRQGQVRLAWAGAISADMLEKYVTPLLEE